MTQLYIYPPVQTSINQGPIEFVRNGSNTAVNQDTATAANSRPLPVIQLDASGAPVVSGALDFGASTAAPRTAAQIGNATGAADFNSGAVSAQTLRAVLESQNRDAIGSISDAASTNPLISNSIVSILKGLLIRLENVDFGATTTTIRTAAVLGNATGAVDYNIGAASAQTLRVALETQTREAIGAAADAAVINPALSGSLVALLKGLLTALNSLDTKTVNDYGVSSSAQRVASQIGNATGAADFDAGVVGAQTLRVVIDNFTRNGIGGVTDIAVIDPALSGSQIALAKGVLTGINSIDGKIASDYGASTGAVRVAAQIGNAAGVADFNVGAVGAQTPRVVLEDQSRNSLGAIADAAETDPSGSASVIALLKGILTASNTGNTSQSGTITQAVKTVGTTAVRATVAGTAPSAGRLKLFIKPTIGNTGKIFIGSSGVTTSNGLEIVGPDRLEFIGDASDYYLISDTAGQSVEVLEVV